MSVTHVGRLIVVRDGQREPRFRCLIPGCGAVFYDGEERAYEAHAVRCSAEREETLREESPRSVAMFDPLSFGDVELVQWARRHRGALIEDRMRI